MRVEAAMTQQPEMSRDQMREQIREQIREQAAQVREQAAQIREHARQIQEDARAAQQQAAQARSEGGVGVGGAVPPIPPVPPIPVQGIPGRGDPFQTDPVVPDAVVIISIAFFIMLAVIAIGIPIARAFGRRMDRQQVDAKPSPDVTNRLERIEHAVEAIAIEVERISEGQRFTTKLLAERAAAEQLRGGQSSDPPRRVTPH